MQKRTHFPLAPIGEKCSRCASGLANGIVHGVWRHSGDDATPASLGSVYCLCTGTTPPVDRAAKDQRSCGEFHKLGRMSYLSLRGRGDEFAAECLNVEPPPKREGKKAGGAAGASAS